MQLFGIMCDDSINKYKEKIPLSTMLKMYENQWKDTLPLSVNHDRTRIIGYSTLSGVYIQPRKAAITTSMLIPETREEEERVARLLSTNNGLLNNDQAQTLYTMVEKCITGNYSYYDLNSTAIFNPGIVTRLFPNLANKFDEDGLIDISELSLISPGLYRQDKFIIYAHHYFRRNLSYKNSINTPFINTLEQYKKEHPENSVKIRIDLDTVGLYGTQTDYREYAYWWGPKFTDDLSSLSVGLSHFENERHNCLSSPIRFTECGWYIQDGRKTFECEEVNDTENIKLENNEMLCGCRYVHSMVDEINNAVHLDGAIRGYSIEKMLIRLDQKMSDSKRDTVYTKLWRIDGRIQIAIWKELITHYYRDNQLIGEYFEGIDQCQEKEVVPKKEKMDDNPSKLCLKDFIPVDFTPEDGINVFISYHDRYNIDDRQVVILPDLAYAKDEELSYIEEFAISFAKLANRNGVNVQIPDVPVLTFHSDMNINLPTFICDSVETANTLIKCLYDFCNIWIALKSYRQLSITVGINQEEKSLLFSFVGHIKAFICCFEANCMILPKPSDLIPWVDNIYAFLSRQFSEALVFAPNDTVFGMSQLRIPRKAILKQIQYNTDSVGLKFSTILSEEELSIIETNKISVTGCIEIKSQICNKCKNEYATCKCIKFVDDCTTTIMKARNRGIYWILHNASDVPENEMDKQFIPMA